MKLLSFLISALALAALPVLYAEGAAVTAGPPAFYNDTQLLTAHLTVAGLAAQDTVVRLDASASNETYCLNPVTGSFEDAAPSVAIVRGILQVPASAITADGSATFSVATVPPATLAPVVVGCEEGDIVYSADMAFREAVITVQQPAGTAILTIDCTFNPLTLAGPLADAYTTCTTDGEG